MRPQKAPAAQQGLHHIAGITTLTARSRLPRRSDDYHPIITAESLWNGRISHSIRQHGAYSPISGLTAYPVHE